MLIGGFMIRLLVLLSILVLNVSVAQAHGSSHYVCVSEQVGYDRIDHCTSYHRPVPDKIWVGYYTEEQIQDRQDRQDTAELIATTTVLVMVVLFIFAVLS